MKTFEKIYQQAMEAAAYLRRMKFWLLAGSFLLWCSAILLPEQVYHLSLVALTLQVLSYVMHQKYLQLNSFAHGVYHKHLLAKHQLVALNGKDCADATLRLHRGWLEALSRYAVDVLDSFLKGVVNLFPPLKDQPSAQENVHEDKQKKDTGILGLVAENTFYNKFLYRQVYYLYLTVLTLAGCLLVFVSLWYFKFSTSGEDFIVLLMGALSFSIVYELANELFSYRASYKAMDDIHDALMFYQHETDWEQAALVARYFGIIENAPPIYTAIYNQHSEKLAHAWGSMKTEI